MAGNLLLNLALLSFLVAAVVFTFSLRLGPRFFGPGKAFFAAGVLLSSAALLFLGTSLWAGDFSLTYVARHSHSQLPAAYKLAALWSGREGSLLLWMWFVGVLAAVHLFAPSGRYRPAAVAGAVCALETAFFAFVLTRISPVFALLETAPADGEGLSLLLMNGSNIIHPPALLLGYSGFTVTFAVLIARLLDKEPRGSELERLRLWLLFSWLTLGLGIMLGARWAYEVLGWGGYWAWDPVENASLIPWLTATAGLHFLVRDRWRGQLRLSTAALIAAGLPLVVFGTYLTRSGLLESVHAFAGGKGSMAFLLFAGVSLAAFGWASIWRWQRGGSNSPLDRAPLDKRTLVTRGGSKADGLLFWSGACLVFLAVVILIGTLSPFLSRVLFRRAIFLGPGFFTRASIPAAVVVVTSLLFLFARKGHASLAAATAHLGVIIMMAGFCGSVLEKENVLTMVKGQAVVVSGYELEYTGFSVERRDGAVSHQAQIELKRGLKRDTLYPGAVFSLRRREVVSEVAIYGGFLRDIYVILDEWVQDLDQIKVRVLVNPLVNLVWSGTFMVLAGGLVSMMGGVGKWKAS